MRYTAISQADKETIDPYFTNPHRLFHCLAAPQGRCDPILPRLWIGNPLGSSGYMIRMCWVVERIVAPMADKCRISGSHRASL